MDTIIELIKQFIPQNEWFNLITAVVALASALLAILPAPKPDSVLSKIYKVIAVLAMNVKTPQDKEPAKPADKTE